MNPLVIDVLKSISLPLIKKSPVELNYVKRADFEDGIVKLHLELRAPHTNHLEAIKAEILQKCSEIPGVQSVQIDIQKADVKKSTSPPKDNQKPAEVNEALAGIKHILGVASGKGGVGKSTVTANLAMALSLEGKKVGVLDADIYGPSMNMMFNLSEAPRINEDRTVHPVVAAGGIKIISMAMFAESDKAVIWRGPMASQMIQNFLTRVHWGELDVLLIDFPPGTGDIQLTLTQNCPMSGALIVTTPQNVSVIDARKGLQMFDTVSVPVIGVLENMSYFSAPDGSKHHIFRSGGGQRIAQSLGLPFLGEMPLDPAVSEGGDIGTPVTMANPNSVISKRFSEVAEYTMNQLELLKSKEGGMLNFDLHWNDLELEES
jgi:ATP-binding protein involved in chromosome partitioning